MKMPKITISDVVESPTIVQSELPGGRGIHVLTSYDPSTDTYASTVHVDEPFGVIKEYRTPAADTDGLWVVHAYIVGVVLACGVLTGTIAPQE